MAGKELSVVTFEMEPEFTLDELCDICHSSPEFIFELIEFGTIEPKGVAVETWRFDVKHLRRIQCIMRLQQDLEVNLPGAALAIDLMEEIDHLQSELDILERHLFYSTR